MNFLFLLLIFGATAASVWTELSGAGPTLSQLSELMIKSATDAIQLGLVLAATMALFIGALRVAEKAGILPFLARPLMPVLIRLFPSLAAGSPTLDRIALNVAANMLGMGNAATPFGVRAMEALEDANPAKGRASDAQIMFLALNTAGITLLPTKIIALRASMGSADPAAVMGPTLAASICAAIAGLTAAWMLSERTPDRPASILANWRGLALPLVGLVALAVVMILFGTKIGPFLIPVMICGFLVLGWARGVAVYEGFVEGARDGLAATIRILPYLIAIMVAVGMARASGALDWVLAPIAKLTAPLGLPAPALMMAVIRSLSGSGAFGFLASTMGQPEAGPDTPLGILLGTLYGTTETTFYVIAVYFGAVGIRDLRHAVAVGVIADIAGCAAATAICALRFGMA